MRKYCKVDHVNGTKQCADCGEVKPISGFPIRQATGYVYAYCKPCNTRRAVEWSKKNRERKNASERERIARDPEKATLVRRRAHYKRAYGIAYDDYLAILEKQSFRCAICEGDLSQTKPNLDHCHTTGRVRGILCNPCNVWLAPLENRGYLDKALAYLESHRSES